MRHRAFCLFDDEIIDGICGNRIEARCRFIKENQLRQVAIARKSAPFACRRTALTGRGQRVRTGRTFFSVSIASSFASRFIFPPCSSRKRLPDRQTVEQCTTLKKHASPFEHISLFSLLCQWSDFDREKHVTFICLMRPRAHFSITDFPFPATNDYKQRPGATSISTPLACFGRRTCEHLRV